MARVYSNPRGCTMRGFLLGMLYAQGKVLTTARIRKELGVSQATAKRYMQGIRRVVAVSAPKPFVGCAGNQPQFTLPLRKAA